MDDETTLTTILEPAPLSVPVPENGLQVLAAVPAPLPDMVLLPSSVARARALTEVAVTPVELQRRAMVPE